MTLIQHQRLAGAGLTLFALLEFAIMFNAGLQAKQFYLEMKDTDPKTLLLGILIFGFVIGFSLVLAQAIGGLRMVFVFHPVPAWGLVASIVAITTLWGLPVGIYGVWTQIALNKEKTKHLI